MKNATIALLFALASVLVGFSPAAVAQEGEKDSHAGYYYPPAQSNETYISRLAKMASVTKRSRVGFIVGLNAMQLKRGYAPGYHMFAKGANAQKLIIIATEEYRYNTLYRLRALMASLTANARKTPLFSESDAPEELNFLDLMKLAGFTQVTISNGKDVTHQIFVV